MELWQTILTTAITTLVGIVVTDIVIRLKTSGKKHNEARRKERLKEIREVVEEVIEPVKIEITEIKQDITAIRDTDVRDLKKANRDSLRNQLYNIYDKCIEYRTASDIENEAEMFDSYKALNGNHGCDTRHNLFMQLPTEDQYFYNKRQDSDKKENK